MYRNNSDSIFLTKSDPFTGKKSINALNKGFTSNISRTWGLKHFVNTDIFIIKITSPAFFNSEHVINLVWKTCICERSLFTRANLVEIKV